MKAGWWKEADEEARVDQMTRESLERALDRKAEETRRIIASEKEKAKARQARPVRLSKMRPIAYYADVLGFAESTIRGWIKDGALNAYYIGGTYRICEADITAFIAREDLKRG